MCVCFRGYKNTKLQPKQAFLFKSHLFMTFKKSKSVNMLPATQAEMHKHH